MTKNKEIIEKLVELVEIYLENAQMNEVSTEWQEGDIDFEEVLSIVVHDGLYDLNFTEEQTNEFLALYKALNQEQVEISEAKLGKKDKKGDDIMEKEVKLINEWFQFDEKTLEQKYGKEIKTWEEMKVAAKGSSWGMAGDVGLDGKVIPESGKRYWDTYTKNGGKFFLSGTGDSRVLTLVELKPKITRFDAMDRPVADESLKQDFEEQEDQDMDESKKPVMESKKPIKEGIRLIYNPKEKPVKEEVKLSFDGEPLPLDIKESNTHTKLRLFKHK
jgi:hypothetical protein